MEDTIISTKNFRIHLTKYLNMLGKGKSFILLKRSKPVGRIIPFDKNPENKRSKKVDQLLSFAGAFSNIDEEKWIKNVQKNRSITHRKAPVKF